MTSFWIYFPAIAINQRSNIIFFNHNMFSSNVLFEFFTIYISVRLSDRSYITHNKINLVKNCPQFLRSCYGSVNNCIKQNMAKFHRLLFYIILFYNVLHWVDSILHLIFPF